MTTNESYPRSCVVHRVPSITILDGKGANKMSVLFALGVQLTAGHLLATTLGGALFGAAVAFITN